MGQSAEIFCHEEEIFASFLTEYFTDYEPESCFIAQVKGKVVGYIIGAKDAKVLEKTFTEKILPKLLKKVFFGKVLLKPKNLHFLFQLLISSLRGEVFAPSFYKQYPATLHINLLKEWRGNGAGSRLILAYLDYLKQLKVPGVCLATMSDKGGLFFEKQGFKLLHKGQRSYFYHILHKKIPVYIYGKLL